MSNYTCINAWTESYEDIDLYIDYVYESNYIFRGKDYFKALKPRVLYIPFYHLNVFDQKRKLYTK